MMIEPTTTTTKNEVTYKVTRRKLMSSTSTLKLFYNKK